MKPFSLKQGNASGLGARPMPLNTPHYVQFQFGPQMQVTIVLTTNQMLPFQKTLRIFFVCFSFFHFICSDGCSSAGSTVK